MDAADGRGASDGRPQLISVLGGLEGRSVISLPRGKQTCVDCHFFMKEARGIPGGPHTLEVKEDERAKSRSGDYSWHLDHYVVTCDFRVWDEGHNFDRSRKHEILTQVQRRDSCFFWKHRPGMLLPAARLLQEREAKAREARGDRRLTMYGLWLAAFALVAQVWLQIAAPLKWWPFSQERSAPPNNEMQRTGPGQAGPRR